MRLGAAIIATLLAAPSAALTPLPPCSWDPAAQRLSPSGSAEYYAFVQEAGDGFASSIVDGTEAYEFGARAFILQHCPSGQELLVVLPEGNTDRFREVYSNMVFGPEPYTMRQIAEALAPMGAGARMTESEFGNCACDWLYGEGA